jgi:hypothetical protein
LGPGAGELGSAFESKTRTGCRLAGSPFRVSLTDARCSCFIAASVRATAVQGEVFITCPSDVGGATVTPRVICPR